MQASPEEQPRDPRRRIALLGVVAVCTVVVWVVAITSGSSAPVPVSSNVGEVKRQLAARLHRRLLSPHWVSCVASGRRFEGASVIRCNVNFGDPHIQAYCSVLLAGRIVTNYDDPAIPCGHDDAGWTAPVQTFN